MKKYTSIGELLRDYREDCKMSQADFAAKVNVDIRTVHRWEKNITLLNPEKEDALVQETLLPHQLIRNLNSSITIPTYYDFRIRKYSLNNVSTKLPNAFWFKEQIDITTDRIKPINFEDDIEYIMKYMQFHKNPSDIVNRQIIQEAIKMLPELNVIINDDSGYYAGHCICFPLKLESYEKLKNREILESQLSIKDLANYKTQSEPIIYEYDISADCNDNIFYIVTYLFRFFNNLSGSKYIYSALTSRSDSLELAKHIGLKIIWEDKTELEKLGLEVPLRFMEGNFKDFLAD